MKKIILLVGLLVCSNGWAQVSDEVHQRCKDVADYVGCVQIATGSVPTKENSSEADLRKALKLLPRRLENTSLRDFSSAIQPFTDALALAANDSTTVKQLWMGVLVSNVNKDVAETLGLEVEKGVFIQEVLPNSAAEEAGLQVGDVIVSIDDQELSKYQEFVFALKSKRSGKYVALNILRDNKKKNITALPKEIEEPINKSLLVNQSKRIEGALDVARVAWNNSIDADIKWMGIQNCRYLNQTVEAFNSWMGGTATYYPCTKESSKGIRLESVMLSIIGKSALLAANGQLFDFPPYKTAAQFIEEYKAKEKEEKAQKKKERREKRKKRKKIKS